MSGEFLAPNAALVVNEQYPYLGGGIFSAGFFITVDNPTTSQQTVDIWADCTTRAVLDEAGLGAVMQYETTAKASPGDHATGVAASCPAGTRPLTGGYLTGSTGYATFNAPYVTVPTATSPASSWDVLYSGSDLASNPVDVFADCVADPGYRIQEAEGTPADVAPEAAATATAYCPAGKTVLGGGYVVIGDGNTTESYSSLPGNGQWWSARTTSTSSTNTSYVYPKALCYGS